MGTYLDFDEEVDHSNFSVEDFSKSLSKEDLQSFESVKQKYGSLAPDYEGYFTEFGQSTAQSFISGLRGLGSTLEKTGNPLGNIIKDYFNGVLDRNQQWNEPEGISTVGKVARITGSAVGSTANTLAATTVGTLLGGPKAGVAAGAATAFSQTFGENVERNLAAGYSEDKAYGMAFLESGIDGAIEMLPFGVSGKVVKNAGRFRRITQAGKKELLKKVGQRIEKQVGKETARKVMVHYGKEMAKTGFGEGFEEGLQYLNSYLNRKIGGDPNAEFSLEELADGISQGIIGGFFLGGVMNVPGMTRDTLRLRNKGENTDTNTEPTVPVVPEENMPDMPDIPAAVENGSVIEGSPESLIQEETRVFDNIVHDVGEYLGIKVEDVRNHPDYGKVEDIPEAFYDAGNKTIYVPMDGTSSASPVMILGHELKHYIDDQNPELSKEFDRIVSEGLTDLGLEVHRDNDGKIVETSADVFGQIFARPETWEKVAAKLNEKTPGLGERFIQMLQNFIQIVKKRLMEYQSDPGADQMLKDFEAAETEVVRILADLRRRNGTSNQVENVIGASGNTTVESVPVSSINVDAERFQFKSNTNKKSGVDESNKLDGDWDARTAGNLYLWQSKDGKLYVVNGHHRLELAQRKGVENLNAIIDRETDGVTAEQARRNGVLINIRDGQGEVRDYASFVRDEKLSEEEAKAQGVTARVKGRSGYLLGKASDTLYEAYRNDVIPESKAVIIAEVAQGNSAVEYAGIKLASERKLSGEALRQTLKLAVQNTSGKQTNAEQGSLFDMVDDSVLKEWEEIGKIAAKHIKEIRTRIEAAKDAIKNPEAAKSLGVKTSKGAEKLLQKAQLDLARWENYATDAELMSQLRSEAGIAEREATANNDTKQEQTVDNGTERKQTINNNEVDSAENAQTAEENKVDTRFDPESEMPLLTAEEDSSDFQLVSETEEEVKAAEERAVKAEEEQRLRISEESRKNTMDLDFESESESESESVKNVFEDFTEREDISFDDFYAQAMDSMNSIIAKFRRRYESGIGNQLEEKWYSAAMDAIAKAYKNYDPKKGAVSTAVSTYITNAINKVNGKYAEKEKRLGGRVSIDQKNEQGEDLSEVISDGKEFFVSDDAEPSSFEEWKQGLDEKDRKILELKAEGFANSEIGRAKGMHMSGAQVELRLKELAAAENEARQWYRFRKRKRVQVIPILRDGKVRDEYIDLLEDSEYTPETIKEWDEKAIEWIRNHNGLVLSAMNLLDNKAPSSRHVAELVRRHILNSEVYSGFSREDRKKLNMMEIKSRSNWGKEGRAMQLRSLRLDDIAGVEALLDKLSERLKDPQYQLLRNKILKAYNVDLDKLPDRVVKDKKLLDGILREHLAMASSIGDKVYEYWISSILSGPTTHVRNFTGNTFNAAYELGIKRFVEALLNRVIGAKDGATFGEFKEMQKAFDWKNAGKAFLEAIDQEVLGVGGKFMENRKIAIGGKLGRIVRAPLRFLNASDAFAKTLLAPVEAAAQAYRMGVQKGFSGEKLSEYIQEQLKDPDSDAYRWGEKRARELAFQEELPQDIRTLIAMRESGGLRGAALRVFLPFISSPYNILRQGVRKSPLGVVNLLGETGKAIKNRKIDSHYIERVSEQVIAWGTLMLLASFMGDDDEQPWITGSPAPYGSGENRFKSNKIPPYSIRFGDTWISYANIEPFSTSMGAMVDMMKGYQKAKSGGDGTDVLKKLFSSNMKIFVDKSYLHSIKEMVSMVEDPERDLTKPIMRTAGSFVPNIYYQIRGSFEDNVQNTKSYERGLEFLKEEFTFVTNKMGVTTGLPKLDYFGREVKKDDYENDYLSPVMRLLGMKMYDGSGIDKADRLIMNYNLQHPDEAYYPLIPNNRFTVDGKKMYLSGEAYHGYARDSGEMALQRIHTEIERGRLNVANPGKKDIDIIKKIFKDSRKEMRKKYLKHAKSI